MHPILCFAGVVNHVIDVALDEILRLWYNFLGANYDFERSFLSNTILTDEIGLAECDASKVVKWLFEGSQHKIPLEVSKISVFLINVKESYIASR